jgi:hypothetical protein
VLTLFNTGGPCVRPSAKLRAGSASWSAIPIYASAQSDETELGINGFESFCRTKMTSAAGRNPGIHAKFKAFQMGHHSWEEPVGKMDTRARKAILEADLPSG